MDNKVNRKYFSRIGFSLFWGTIIAVLLQLLGSVVLGVVSPELANNYDAGMASMMIPLYVLGFPIFMLLLAKRTPAQTIEKKTMSAKEVIIAAAMSYAIVIIGNLFGLGTTAIIALIKGEPVMNPILDVVSNGNMWITSVYTVICAPIFEELLFRKLTIDRTIKYGEGVSIVFSAAIFGLFHGNLNQFVYAFLLGLFFAFIYVKTANVKYCIILHMFVNFMGSTLGLFIMEYFDAESTLGKVVNGASNVFAVALVVIGAVMLIKNRKRFTLEAGECQIEKGKRFTTMFLNVGMILYSVFWIANMVILLLA